MNNKIIILTGEIQAGKTTLLQQFCKNRYDAAGVLTPIIKNKRVFYDIAGNQIFEMEASGNEEKLAIGKYIFSAAAFQKARNLLLTAGQRTDIKYLIIDEIGPLEIRHHNGLYQSFKKILSATIPFILIVVVRQSMANEMIATFGLDKPEILSLQQMKLYFESLP